MTNETMHPVTHAHGRAHSHEPHTQMHSHPHGSLSLWAAALWVRVCCSSFRLLSPETTHEKAMDQREREGMARLPEFSGPCQSWLHILYTCVHMYDTQVHTCADMCPHWPSMHRVESLQVTLILTGIWDRGTGKDKVSSWDTLLSSSLPPPCPEWTFWVPCV